MLDELSSGKFPSRRLGLPKSQQSASRGLRALLAFIAETPGVGWFVKGTKEALSELAKEKDDAELERKFNEMFRLGEQTNEHIRLLAFIASTVFEQNVALAKLLTAKHFLSTPEDLSEFAKDAAILAYRNNVAADCFYADYRGIQSGYRQVHIASFLLDDIYVIPRFVPQAVGNDSRERGREIRRQLKGFVPEEIRADLETEYVRLSAESWRAMGTDVEVLLPAEVISASRQAVVLGGPGTGKSTLLRFIARATALGPSEAEAKLGWSDDLIPILVSLPNFAETARKDTRWKLRAYVEEMLLERGGVALREAISPRLTAGGILLLLDGVDEVQDPSARDALVQCVDEFIADYSDARVIVTSRPYGYVRLRGDIPHYILKSFTSEQVEEFLVKWYRASEVKMRGKAADLDSAEDEARSLGEEIFKNSRVAELATNPLMLVSVVLLRQEHTRLPEDRIELYDKVVCMLLDTWNRWRSRLVQHESNLNLPRQRLVRVWARVAEWSRRKHNTGILYRPVLLRKISEILAERGYNDGDETAETYLNVAAATGILEERGIDIFAFWHPSIEEYFAAVDLSTPTALSNSRLLNRVDDPRWREVNLLSVSYIAVVLRDEESAAQIVNSFVEERIPFDEAVTHNRVLLAAACVADCPALPHRTIDNVIRELATSIRKHPYLALFEGFTKMAEAIMQFQPSESTVRALAEIADVLWEGVRIGASALISNVAGRSERARAALRSILRRQGGAEAFHAARGLWLSGEVTPSVVKGLAYGTDRFNACWIDPRTEQQRKAQLQRVLVDGLSADDMDFRFASARLLLAIPSSEADALSALRGMLDDPSYWSRAAYALQACGKLILEWLPSIEWANAQRDRVSRESDLYHLAEIRLGQDPGDQEAEEVLIELAANGSEIMSALAVTRLQKASADIVILYRVGRALLKSDDAYTVYYGAKLLYHLNEFDSAAQSAVLAHLATTQPRTAVEIASLFSRANMKLSVVIDRLRGIVLESSDDHLPDEADRALWIFRSMVDVLTDSEIIKHCFLRIPCSPQARSAFEKLLENVPLSADEVAQIATAMSRQYPDSYDEHFEVVYTWAREQLTQHRRQLSGHVLES